MFKRVFLIVMDSLGVGEAKDADKYGDVGSNTLKHIIDDGIYNLPVFEKIGLLDLVNNDKKAKLGYHGIIEIMTSVHTF